VFFYFLVQQASIALKTEKALEEAEGNKSEAANR